MKISELIKILKTLPKDTNFKVSSDEELNTIYKQFDFVYDEKDDLVIFGLAGTEEDL